MSNDDLLDDEWMLGDEWESGYEAGREAASEEVDRLRAERDEARAALERIANLWANYRHCRCGADLKSPQERHGVECEVGIARAFLAAAVESEPPR